MAFEHNIVILRRKKSWTQADLAEKIEVKNSRTCNFFVEPLDGGSTVIVQNGCDHHQIGDIIEIP
jgi:hypothetical protein